MKINVPYAKVLDVTNTKEKNCKIIGISLGYDKGFAKVIWWIGEKTFDDANKLKRGVNITIPSGDLSVSSYIGANGLKYQNINIFTTYLEIVNPPKNNNDQETKDKTKKQVQEILDESTTDEEINKAFDDLESGLENVNKNDEQKEIEELRRSQEEFGKEEIINEDETAFKNIEWEGELE